MRHVIEVRPEAGFGLSVGDSGAYGEDLRPWTRKGEPKPGLATLYQAAGVTFVDDLSV
jgi:hypothetical protein